MSGSALLQTQFQRYVLGGAADIEAAVTDGPRLDRRARLDIYANGYWQRLLEVIGTDYPALHALAGDALFERIGRSYIAAHISTTPNARWFGRLLPEFLASGEEFSSRPELAELATLEWAIGVAFDSADDPVLDLALLAALPAAVWSKLAFVAHGSLQQVDLRWNVPAVWTAVQRAEALPEITGFSAPTPWIVWRRDLTTYFRSLQADEAWALLALRNGTTFGGICEGLCDWHTAEQVPLRAMELLKCWIGEGLLSQIRHGELPTR